MENNKNENIEVRPVHSEENNKKKGSVLGSFFWFLVLLALIVWGVIKFSDRANFSPTANDLATPSSTSTLTSTTTATTTNTLPVERILVSGNGFEPGWYFEIVGTDINNTSAKAVFVVDYAESTLYGTLNKAEMTNGFKYSGVANPSATSTLKGAKDVIITFEKEKCGDAAGRYHDYSATLEISGYTEFTGCADIK